VEEPTEGELRAAFGSKADYYLSQWSGAAGRRINWAAFFLSGFWLPYRRLYGITLIFFAIVFVETFAEEIVFQWLGYAAVPRIVERLSTLIPALVCGAWGNRWYL
jgi:hypothetical protein